MRQSRFIFPVLLLFFSLSCAPTWQKPLSTTLYFPGDSGYNGGKEIFVGMAQDKVLALLGEPTKKKNTSVVRKEEVWVYSKLHQQFSSVKLTFRDKLLVEINEFSWHDMY